MLVLDLLARAFGLSALTHIGLAALLPGGGVSGPVRLRGILGHLFLAALFGTLFAFVVRPLPPRYGFLLGLVWGLSLYLFNMGFLGPALGLIRPIWTYDYLTMAVDLALHLVYGGVLGLLIAANAPAEDRI